MMHFFNRTGLEAHWGHWAGDRAVARLVCRLRVWYCWSTVFGCSTPLQRQEKKKGPAGASPVAALMPKSVSF